MHRCSYEPTFNLERPSCCSETWIDGHVGVSEKGSPQSSFAIAFNQLGAPHFQSPMLVTRLYHGDCPQWICGHVDANYGTPPRSRVPANLVYVYNICVCLYIYTYVYIHTYLPTYIQTYRHTDIHTCMHTYIHLGNKCACIVIQLFLYLYMYSYVMYMMYIYIHTCTMDVSMHIPRHT